MYCKDYYWMLLRLMNKVAVNSCHCIWWFETIKLKTSWHIFFRVHDHHQCQHHHHHQAANVQSCNGFWGHCIIKRLHLSIFYCHQIISQMWMLALIFLLDWKRVQMNVSFHASAVLLGQDDGKTTYQFLPRNVRSESTVTSPHPQHQIHYQWFTTTWGLRLSFHPQAICPLNSEP